MYVKTLDMAAKKKQQDDDNQKKAEAKKAQAAEELVGRSPADLVEMLIDEHIDRRKGKGKGTEHGTAPRTPKVANLAYLYEQANSGDVNPESVQFVQESPSNNGASPAKGGGKNKAMPP